MADDTRVVQMKFDNKDFEKNISTSQKSLDRFKGSLNFEAASRGLEKFGRSVKDITFSTLENNIQKLTDKFTGLGDAGEYVISRLRAGFEGLLLQAEQFVKSMTLEQVNVGQSKYDALTRSVQTIVAGGTATEQKAYSVMERVMEYTNQTSHSFETMVGQISSLTSMGVPLEKAEKLMEGFANASTKAGADASKAAIAMQVYAKGMGSALTKQEFDTLNLTARVVTKEWREQMIEAGIAAGDLEKETNGTIKTAKKYGKQVEVTADTIENTLSKKWATKKTLQIFGEKYMFGETVEELKHPEKVADSFGKTAFLTGQRALTFADALNAVKESISSGWMDTFRISFGDLTDAMNLFTGACNLVIDALSGIAEARNNILKAWKSVGGRDTLISLIFGEMEDADGNKLYEGAYGIVNVIQDVGNIITEAFWHTFMNLIPESKQREILDMVNSQFRELGLEKPFESFQELYDSDWGKEHGFREGLFGGAMMGLTESVKNFVQGINDWFNDVDPSTGLSRLQKIQIVLDAVGRTLAFFAQIGAGFVHFLDILGDQDHLGPSVRLITNLLASLGLTVTETENEVSNTGGITKFFEGLADILKPACDLINLVVGSLTELIEAIVLGEQENQNIGKVIARVGDIFKKVFGVILDFATPLAHFVSDVSGIIGDLFKDGFTQEGMEKAKKRFSAAFSALWHGLKAAAMPIIREVGAFFTLLWDEVKTRVINYFNDPESVGHKVLEVLRTVFTPILNFLKPIWEAIKNVFTGSDGKIHGPTLFDTLKAIFLSESVTNLFKKLKDLATSGGLYKLVMAALGGVAIWRIIKAVNTIGGFFDDVGGNLKAGILGTYEWFSEKIQGIAKGILMLTASVAVLGSMDTKSVIQGVIALGVIMGEFVAFTKLMNTVNASTLMQQAALTGAISIFAGAIGILVLSLLPFALVSWEGFARMIGGLTLVLFNILGFMELMKVLGLSTYGLNFTGIAKFAFAISLLSFSLIPFMIADWQSMMRGVSGLALVLLELIGFMELMKVLGLSTFGLNMAGIARFALAIGILMFSMVPFMIADWQSMLRAVSGLAIVLAELLGFMELMKALGLSTYGLHFSGIAKFAIAVSILMLSLIPFMVTDWSGMLRAVAGLASVLVELIAFMELMKVFGLSTLGLNFSGIITFALSIGVLMLSLIPFMVTDWSGMFRAVAGLGLVLAELIGFMELMKVLSLSTFGLNFAGIFAFTASIAVLILALKSFAYMDWEQWARAVAGLTVILGEIIGFMALAQTITFNAAAIGMVVAVCLSIGVMALMLSMAMNEVRNLKWEVITAFTAGMATVIVALAVAIAALSAVPLVAGIKGIVLIGLGLAALLGIVALLGPHMIESFGDSFAHLSGKLEMISGLLKGFSDRMGQIDEGNISKAESIFDQLKRMMRKLAGWGQFTGDLDNFGYSMFVLGTGMEIFNTHVGNAVNDLDGNTQAALKFIQDLSGCAGDLDTISKLNLDALISAVMMLGGAMSIYAYGAKEINGLLSAGDTPDENTVTAAISILQAISTGLADAGGFTIPENMPDEQQLTLFGASLSALATALIRFEEAGSGLGSGTTQALRVLDFFSELKGKLISDDFKKSLGAAIGIFDEAKVKREDLTEFGLNIEQLGLALASFNQSVTILDESTGERKPIDFTNAVNTLDSLVALQGQLGWDFGPVIQFFAGRKKDFADLGGEIEALGTAMKDFIDKLGGVDEQGQPKMDTKLFDEALGAADKVAVYLKELQKKMGTVGGLWNTISISLLGRDYNFTDLKKQMEDLATGIGSLGQLKIDSKLITVDDTTGIFKAVDDIINYLGKLKKQMGKVGGLLPGIGIFISGRDYDFRDLKEQLTKLGEGLAGLTAFKVEDLPTAEEMSSAFPMIDALLEYMNTLHTKVSDGDGSVGGLYNIVNRALEGREFNFEDLEKQLTAIGNGLSSIAKVNIDSEGNTLFNAEGRGAAIDTIDALLTYMTTLGTSLGKVGGIAEFFQTLWEGKEADFEYVGAQLGHLGEGLGKFSSGLNANGTFDAATATSAIGAVSQMVSVLRQMAFMNDLLEDVELRDGFVTQKISSIGEYMYKLSLALDYMTDGYHEISGGGHVFDSIAIKMAEFLNTFKGALDEFGGAEQVQSAADILNNVSVAIANLVTAARNSQLEDGGMVDFSQIGIQICNGIIAGIQAGQSGVSTAAAMMARQAYEAACAELGIESPSRVFREIGMYVGEGMRLGVLDSEPGVTDEIGTMAENTVSEATQLMATLASLLSQDVDANPTITPVLDLSNVTAGAAMMNDLLGRDYDSSLSTNGNSYARSAVPNTDKGTSDYLGQDFSWLQSTIENLGNRIDSMGSQISRMQIVLDSGTLAGAVTDGVNRNLGSKTTYRRRRN